MKITATWGNAVLNSSDQVEQVFKINRPILNKSTHRCDLRKWQILNKVEQAISTLRSLVLNSFEQDLNSSDQHEQILNKFWNDLALTPVQRAAQIPRSGRCSGWVRSTENGHR